jgi:hypothetical protein
VIDSRLSAHWRVGLHEGTYPGSFFSIIAFKEWAGDRFYYDPLTDGDQHAVETFRRYKELLDLEAAELGA